MKHTRPTRSDRLLQVLGEYRQVFVVTHDTPDPDAIAGGWALSWLIQERLGKPARLLGGGKVMRAENKHMLELLRPPIEMVETVDCPDDTAIVLVDCGLGSQNHLLAGQDLSPVAVIDHHLGDLRKRRRVRFRDVRPQVVASATICACYLREQTLEPSPELATALLYAIHTETRGSRAVYSRDDRSISLWLTGRADMTRLAEIENAPLSVEYFADLVLAVQNTMLYGTAALCLMPRASGTEIVGEVADLLIRCEPVRSVLCGAVVEGDLVFSVRTRPGAGDATHLVLATLANIGHGGGHHHRAGGRIRGNLPGPGIDEDLQDELRNRWLGACGLPPQHGTYLVPRQEIVANL